MRVLIKEEIVVPIVVPINQIIRWQALKFYSGYVLADACGRANGQGYSDGRTG